MKTSCKYLVSSYNYDFFFILFFCAGQILFKKGKAIEPSQKSTTFVSLKKINLVFHLENDANNFCKADFDIFTFYRQIEANIGRKNIGGKR